MRTGTASLTAQIVSFSRGLATVAPRTRTELSDVVASELLPAPLGATLRALERSPGLARVAGGALSAASLGLVDHLALRTLAIDDAAREAMRAEVKQLVLLGAGLDNRAGRLKGFARAFEIDHPDMQRYKRDRLAQAEVIDHRVLVPVNFEHDRLDASMERAGFSKETPTFWIWEGVTPYLTPQAIESTLEQVGSLSAPGSRLCVTYMRPAADVGHSIDRLGRFLGDLVGEHLRGQYRRHEMEELLARFGFGVLSDEADIDLANRYWKDPPSAHPRTIHLFPEWERLAVAERR